MQVSVEKGLDETLTHEYPYAIQTLWVDRPHKAV